jgi:hypothetical protein
MEMSGQLHTPCCFTPQGKNSSTNCAGDWVSPRAGYGEDKLLPTRESNAGHCYGVVHRTLANSVTQAVLNPRPTHVLQNSVAFCVIRALSDA